MLESTKQLRGSYATYGDLVTRYHKCMSEVYFTRALMWILYTGVVLKLNQSEWAVPTAVVCGILSASYAYRSFKEFGRSI